MDGWILPWRYEITEFDPKVPPVGFLSFLYILSLHLFYRTGAVKCCKLYLANWLALKGGTFQAAPRNPVTSSLLLPTPCCNQRDLMTLRLKKKHTHTHNSAAAGLLLGRLYYCCFGVARVAAALAGSRWKIGRGGLVGGWKRERRKDGEISIQSKRKVGGEKERENSTYVIELCKTT